MHNIFSKALGAALIAGAACAATAAPAPQSSGTIWLRPGQSVEQAQRQAWIAERVQTLRASWAASGHAPAIGAAPTLSGGAIVSTTLTVGVAKSVPVISFSYSTGSPGLAQANFVLTSPGGNQSISVNYTQGPYSTSGKVKFANYSAVAGFSQPGTWTLTAAFLTDQSGASTQYDAAQLAGLFQPAAVSVVNTGLVDYTPPVITAGRVLTPTVSLSATVPQFSVAMKVSDDVSGVVLPFIYIQPPSSIFGQTNLFFAPFPVLSGDVKAYANLFAGQPTGTWTISGYEACDLAGNCFTDTNPADVMALFGTTTFNVTL